MRIKLEVGGLGVWNVVGEGVDGVGGEESFYNGFEKFVKEKKKGNGGEIKEVERLVICIVDLGFIREFCFRSVLW